MAVSDGEIEALAARKWPRAVMGDERERERGREREREFTFNVLCHFYQ